MKSSCPLVSPIPPPLLKQEGETTSDFWVKSTRTKAGKNLPDKTLCVPAARASSSPPSGFFRGAAALRAALSLHVAQRPGIKP